MKKVQEATECSMEESDISSHDGLHNNECSGDEGGSKDVDKKKFRVFNPAIEMDDPKFELELLFKCKTDFINAAKSHGVKYGRKIRFKKNNSNRCKAIYKGKRCMWNIYCSVRSDKMTFQIKSILLTHTCGRTTYHGLASVTYLANKYLEDIRLNPNFNVGDFMIKVHKDLGVSITPNVGYKVRAKAKEMIHGDVMSQYSKLWSYCEEFQKGCRYTVSLDGCHSRGCHKGVLLTAVGIDPNDQLFPIVYAVVETENKNSWKWFVEELKGDLEIIDESIWTFMTDKQKGLIQTIQEVLPGVEHRMCVWHMYNNFKKQHPDLVLKERIWVAARVSYRDRFAGLMESLKEFDEGAYNWQKPILDMLETVGFYLMVRMEKKREWIKKYIGEICPKILKKLEKNKLAVNDCIPSHSKNWKFEIRCMYGDRYTVDLISRCCSCRKWDLNGIPCAHAIAAICDTGKEPEKFVYDCYSKEAYMRAYEPMISPMNAEQI
ncbi:uncharacterized protein LOC113771542 [Coffea eugenioides]|uniref:uncharacterized protein LOC113771542 n=1 Tax=Coffea eugenioides TaxID=49369 RepID=UPI000F604817|nr:uncharacterized protein LOC113771542 [Coffea eugenioides]